MAKKSTSEITLSFPNPFEAFEESLSSIKDSVSTLLDEAFTSERQERLKSNKFFSNLSLPKFNFNFNKKSGLQLIIPVVLVLVLLVGIFAVVKKDGGEQVAGVATNINDIKTMPINREFKFPLTDAKGKKAGEFTYEIESAEVRKQIIVKGTKATAVDGRIFFLLNIKITNDLKQGITINSRDYVRFEVGQNSKELLAADNHNDPVEVQAISTKYTRLGIAVDEGTSEVKILVGEIEGPKTTIPLKF